MEASEDLRRPGSGKKSEIGGDVTHLSINLAPAGDSGVAVGARHGLHVGCTVSNLITRATEQLADWVGHQHADHTHLAEMTGANQSPGFSCMAGVMPWAADEKLDVSFLRQFDKAYGFRGGHGHGLFYQYMLAKIQGRVCMIVMAVRAAAHNHGLQTLDCQKLRNCGASNGHPKIVCNLSRLAGIALLDCNKFGCGMRKKCRDMGIGSPPSGPDHTAFNSFRHQATSTVEKGCMVIECWSMIAEHLRISDRKSVV